MNGPDNDLPSSRPRRDPAVRPTAEAVEPGGETDERVRLAGRLMGRRDLGKLMFFDLVDRSGRIQLLVQRRTLADVDLALGDLVGGLVDPRRRSVASPASPSRSSSCWRRTSGRCPTRSTASPTRRFATGSATSTWSSTRKHGRTSSCDLGSSRPFVGTSIPKDSWRWRRRFCSRGTAERSRSLSSRTRTSSTRTCICGSRRSSTSSA